jgi:roadblock/LC7 domain-containing protein
MNTWNYRIIEYPKDKKTKIACFMIHEVYYDNGKIVSYTCNSVKALGETAEELIADLNMMLEATKKPVLKLKELDKEIKKNNKKRIGGKK